jgi:hypothetical protein
MCRSTGALQVLHLGTCYSLHGYPGRPRALHPAVNARQPALARFLGAEFLRGRAVGGRILGV